MISITSANLKKVCATRTGDVAASLDLNVILAKPPSTKPSKDQALLRLDATMSPANMQCRSECGSFSSFMRAYDAASKEQQIVAGFDVTCGTSKTCDFDDIAQPHRSTLFLSAILIGCFGLGVLTGRCK